MTELNNERTLANRSAISRLLLSLKCSYVLYPSNSFLLINGWYKQIISVFSSFSIHFFVSKDHCICFKESSNKCFQFIQSLSIFSFEKDIIRWFEANSFHIFICQKQLRISHVVEYSFQSKEMFLPKYLTAFDANYVFSSMFLDFFEMNNAETCQWNEKIRTKNRWDYHLMS